MELENKEELERFLVYVPKKDKRRMKELALKKGISASNIMRGLIKDYIKANTPVKKLKKKIEC
ncbi:hypothetical protein C4D33_14385 [Clostridium perfringens]